MLLKNSTIDGYACQPRDCPGRIYIARALALEIFEKSSYQV